MIELETDIFKLYWWDEDKTILVIEILKPWVWESMYDLHRRTNKLLDEMEHETYTILYISDVAGQFPSDNQLSIKHLARLIALDPSNEELIFFTGNVKFLKILIKISDKLHKLAQKTGKYRYAETIEDALVAIEQYKSKIPS